MSNALSEYLSALFEKLSHLGFAHHPLADKIQWERHHLFMREVGPRMAATLVAAVVVGLLFMQSASTTELCTWFGMNLLAGLNSWLIIRHYHKTRIGHRPDPNQQQQRRSIHRWHMANLYLALLWGFQWAALPLLFLADASLVQIFSMLLLVTIVSATPSMTMGLYPDVYITFLTPVLGAFGLHLATMELDGTWLHKIMAPAVWVSLVGFSYAMFKTQIHTLALRLELEQSKQKIEQANKAKTRFLAAASHDIRQPLQAASLYWSTIDPARLAPQQQPLFERLGTSLKATNELLNHLLDVSRLDAGVTPLRPQATDVATLLDELRIVFLPLAQRKNLHLDIECDAEVSIWCDRSMTFQILKNLLANAVQYTLDGGILVRVIAREQQVQINVEDTGMGISLEHQHTIFEEFVQLDNPGRLHQKGLGLGLAIVKRLCQLQQVPLQLDSRQGQGSCFSLIFPRTRPALFKPPEANTEEAPHCRLNGLKILLVDDQKDILDALSLLLVSWDCDVWIAQSLANLKQQLDQPACLPDVVISDDSLTDDGNFEQILATLRHQLPYTPAIIIMTGNTTPQRVKQLTQTGYPLLYKPIETAQLKAALQNADCHQETDTA
ncbi:MULTISPECIES: hybrid sensor histidine kinase/response regulator [unclassified Oceanobacter]|uniref:ATP-binding response regulator n=2 Tax=Gammaproteobacteria TaxID=1236 RepID=UPI00273274C9|nr:MULTISPECIES: hybrid sensor histidine kinase/response regulator [unclassified Oceanobacter]MDP2610296.1 hybrid sensor histidine kinase/response regulator [Oceanobacter sp. 1_MG-2023]MDP2613566.1 hybrid sensor histidine kinase/response regulator [Oceanobacter sp. 2_MG-2023]